MANHKQKKSYRNLKVKLSPRHQRKIKDLLKHGIGSARLFRRAMVLQFLDRSMSAEKVSAAIGATPATVRNIGWRYLKGGLHRALYDLPRPGKQPLISSHQEKEIIAVVCSTPVHQKAYWTLDLLKEEVIRRRIIPDVSRNTLQRLLHQCQVKPWLEKNVVHWGTDRRVHPENGRYSRHLREGI